MYKAKEITKKVYGNITNSIKLENRMGTTFMNSGNSKTSDPHRLLLNFSDKINLYRSDTCVVSLSNLQEKSYIRTINLKYQPQHGMKI